MPVLTTLDLSKNIASEPSYVLNFAEHGQIHSILLSPYELSQDILLVAFPNGILVMQLSFQEEVEKKDLVQFNHGVLCTTLALSPETSVNTLPPLILFAAGGSDFNMRIFKSDLEDVNTCKILKGHTNYINDISYDPENNYIASCSDDCTVLLWSTSDYRCSATFKLMSPGQSVCWHREDSSKLLVAEKSGAIRFYNVNTHRPILSLDLGKPLASAHWAPSDSQLVGSFQNGELVLWNLTRPSRPIQSKLLYSEMGGHIKFSPLGELVATSSPLDRNISVTHVYTQQLRLSAQVRGLPISLSWHYRLPIVGVGDDTRVCFWKVA